MPRKIYVSGAQKSYAVWMQGELVDKISQADLMVLTGGEDINPFLYNRSRHPKTFFNAARDDAELRDFRMAQFLKIPTVGICRGAQFLCAQTGAILIQDQDNPHHYHSITTHDGQFLTMNSIHHQAQFPYCLKDSDYHLLAFTRGESKHHDGHGVGVELLYDCRPCYGREAEIVYYPKIMGLAIQGHPEMMWGKREIHEPTAKTIKYCQGLLDQLMNGTLK